MVNRGQIWRRTIWDPVPEVVVHGTVEDPETGLTYFIYAEIGDLRPRWCMEFTDFGKQFMQTDRMVRL